jgi:hypothetical protein
MKYNILLLLILLCYTGFAQDKFEVTGQVKDANTKEAIEFCPVSAYNPKDSLIATTVTDEKGYFMLSLDEGTYHLKVVYLGYKKDSTPSFDLEEKKFIGIIKLQRDSAFLKTVTIKSNAAENQLDRDVQIVTDKMKTGASTAKDVLAKVNGVSYDRYNNTIKVDGNPKIIILVDGMEKDQEYIKNLAPDRIRKIEVIRDPGGRYGLEGYSAVINIILKKDYKGTEILLSLESLQDIDAVKKDYIPLSNEVDITLNYVYNKINLYAGYNNSYSNINFNSTNRKEYTNGLVIENNPLDKKDVNFHIKEFSHEGTFGADYYLNPKHTISFESDIYAEPQESNTTKLFSNVMTTYNGTSLENYNSTTTTSSGSLNSSNTLFYNGKPNENNEISANFNYSLFNSNTTNDYMDDSLFTISQQGNDNKNSTKFYLEYTHKFKNKTSLQLGYGNTWQQQHNTLTEDSIPEKFNYSDFRNKLYAYYSWQPTKKFGAKLGAAAENSSPEANGIKRSYYILQPYADIKYAPSDVLSVKLKYRADNAYPEIEDTNPFTVFVDRKSVKTGNPLLKPEVTHKLSMQTDILGGLVTIEPYYHFSDNYLTDFGTLRSDSIFEYSTANAGNYTRYGSEIRFTLPFGETGFILQSDADIFYNSIKYNGKTNEFNFWTMSGQLIYQNEKKGTVAGLKYQKNLVRTITANGYENTDNDFWITFIQQPFFKEKLNVMLLYFIPTGFGVEFNQGGFAKTETYKENRSYDISILKNIMLLEISYRFNKGKSANKTEKNIDQENKNKKRIF